jgi:1-acyl-sn-glycerol-3-phosphate acyltransferase
MMRLLFIRVASNLFYHLLGLLYGFRIEGVENLPESGPYILSQNDLSQMGDAATAIAMLRLIFAGRMPEPVSLGDEYNWAMEPWGWLFDMGDSVPVPRGPGQAVTSYLSAIRGLREGRVVAINPEGETSWEGKLVPAKPAAAYVALRTGAPIVLLVATRGAYEVWPKWAERPHLSGRFVVRIGKPFRVADSPCARVSAEMVAEANRTIEQQMTALIYN